MIEKDGNTMLTEGTFSVFPSGICKGRHPIQQVILAWLWNHKNNEGKCWPSQSTLAQECGISVSSLNKHLDELEKGILITREQRMTDGGKVKMSTLYGVVGYSAKWSTGTPPNGVGTPPNGEELYPKNYNQLELSNSERKKSFQEFVNDNDSVSSKTADRLMKLGWVPKESVEEFRKWVEELAKLRDVTPEQFDKASHEWYVYWSARTDKKIKNHKTSLMNTPLLNPNKKWTK